MKKISIMALCFSLLVPLAGCDAFSSEPTYGGLSVEGFNYTPYNLDRFVIKDKYGNTASGGGDLPPGSGEGSLSCCYALKGTKFTVDWIVYDQDEAMKDAYAPIKDIRKSTTVDLPPTNVKGEIGTRILALHFYPDDHIEFEFRNDLRGSRINYAQVDHRLVTKYKDLMNPDDKLNEFIVFRRTVRIAAEGWKKYRLIDTGDLEQYVYFTLFVNRDFDQHPAVQKILQSTKGKAGAFDAEMKKLPDSVVKEIKNNKFHRVKEEIKND